MSFVGDTFDIQRACFVTSSQRLDDFLTSSSISSCRPLLYDFRDSSVPQPFRVDGLLNGRFVKLSNGAFSDIETREMDDTRLSHELWILLWKCRLDNRVKVIVNLLSTIEELFYKLFGKPKCDCRSINVSLKHFDLLDGLRNTSTAYDIIGSDDVIGN